MGGRGGCLHPDRLAGAGLLLRLRLLLLLLLLLLSFCPLARRSGSCGIADGFLGLTLLACCCCFEGDAALIRPSLRWATCMTQNEAQRTGWLCAQGMAVHWTTSAHSVVSLQVVSSSSASICRLTAAKSNSFPQTPQHDACKAHVGELCLTRAVDGPLHNPQATGACLVGLAVDCAADTRLKACIIVLSVQLNCPNCSNCHMQFVEAMLHHLQLIQAFGSAIQIGLGQYAAQTSNL